MRRWVLLLLCALSVSAVLPGSVPAAHAGRKTKAKRYFFEISSISPKATLAPDLEQLVLPRLAAEVKKQLEAHPQLVTSLPDAPDPRGDATAYRRYLTKRGLAGAYLVRVELTAASEEVEQLEDRAGQRLIVRLSVHMLGETVPGRTIGFTGDGSSSIRQGIGKTLRSRDREYTWQGAVELAVSDAINTSLAKLSAPTKK